MLIKQTKNNPFKTALNVVGTIATILLAIYVIAFMFTMIGVISGAIAPEDNSLSSQFIRFTLRPLI